MAVRGGDHDHNSVNDGESCIVVKPLKGRQAHTQLVQTPLRVPQPVKPQTLVLRGWHLYCKAVYRAALKGSSQVL